jgi:hypothetical protein
MTLTTTRRAASACWLGLLLLGGAGCAGGGGGYDAYIPPRDQARHALEVSLNAWQHGRPPGRMDTDAPPVQAVDCKWLAGQKLRAYDIVGEVHGDSPRCFAVKLTLENPSQAQQVRYYVVGISPLWVLRQEDYDMLAHWECMDPAALRGAGSATAESAKRGR